MQRVQSEQTSIRRIFDEETMNSNAGNEVDFATAESRLQKAMRRTRPAVPRTVEEFDSAVRESTYNMIDGELFYSGLFTSKNGHSATIFLTKESARFLCSANEIFFDWWLENRMKSIELSSNKSIISAEWGKSPLWPIGNLLQGHLHSKFDQTMLWKAAIFITLKPFRKN